jgi:hypothetical protein
MPIGAGFGNRNSDGLTETILHAQGKERFALGAQGAHVACVTEM